jgi:hypothetical protein
MAISYLAASLFNARPMQVAGNLLSLLKETDSE